eukprot:1152362-Pelagomonas_calceolata.AAC.2
MAAEGRQLKSSLLNKQKEQFHDSHALASHERLAFEKLERIKPKLYNDWWLQLGHPQRPAWVAAAAGAGGGGGGGAAGAAGAAAFVAWGRCPGCSSQTHGMSGADGNPPTLRCHPHSAHPAAATADSAAAAHGGDDEAWQQRGLSRPRCWAQGSRSPLHLVAHQQSHVFRPHTLRCPLHPGRPALMQCLLHPARPALMQCLLHSACHALVVPGAGSAYDCAGGRDHGQEQVHRQRGDRRHVPDGLA